MSPPSGGHDPNLQDCQTVNHLVWFSPHVAPGEFLLGRDFLHNHVSTIEFDSDQVLSVSPPLLCECGRRSFRRPRDIDQHRRTCEDACLARYHPSTEELHAAHSPAHFGPYLMLGRLPPGTTLSTCTTFVRTCEIGRAHV